MARYILFILTAITNYYLIMFLWGVSAGFSNYIPIIAAIGTILMFVIATPMLAINFKTGLVVGLIYSLAILSFNIGYLVTVIEDKKYHVFIGLLTLIPTVLNIVTIFFIITGLRKGGSTINPSFKIVLAIVPVIVFLIYLISVWKYSPWQWLTISK
ncbi:MAG: hypothetical protein NVS1B13_19730 [Flavisolibacter sp.]